MTKALDEYSNYYADLLDNTYDCVDRIVLNAYFRMGQGPGGFRTWWRQLIDSDEDLDNTHLMRMAGRFSRRVRAHAKAHQIPLKDCAPGERKHEIAEEYLPKDANFTGVFLIWWLAPPRRFGMCNAPSAVKSSTLPKSFLM